MTLPINGLTRITGFSDAAGRGDRAALRKSQVEAMTVAPWNAPVFDGDGNQIGWTDTRYAVMAVTGSGVQCRVADFATATEANTYVTNDTLGLLS